MTPAILQPANMNDNPLPNRHRYAAEIEGYRPGIIRRILLALHLVKRVRGTSKANWHYSEVDTEGEFICVLCSGPDGQSISRQIYIPPKFPPRQIKHI